MARELFFVLPFPLVGVPSLGLVFGGYRLFRDDMDGVVWDLLFVVALRKSEKQFPISCIQLFGIFTLSERKAIPYLVGRGLGLNFLIFASRDELELGDFVTIAFGSFSCGCTSRDMVFLGSFVYHNGEPYFTVRDRMWVLGFLVWRSGLFNGAVGCLAPSVLLLYRVVWVLGVLLGGGRDA